MNKPRLKMCELSMRAELVKIDLNVSLLSSALGSGAINRVTYIRKMERYHQIRRICELNCS